MATQKMKLSEDLCEPSRLGLPEHKKGKTPMPITALIMGITGQDGSYLAGFHLSEGYEAHGIARRTAIDYPQHRLWRLKHILDKLLLYAGSFESFESLFNVVDQVKPHGCYHLAAQRFVSYSFEGESSTINANINGTHFISASIKQIMSKP
jgi:GDPmannose 4,6-dehydratase